MSNDTTHDVSWAIVPRSDQLNADSLLAGPRDVQITGTSAWADDKGQRRLEVRLRDELPWRPCKSMARVLVAAWGADSRQWIGRRVRLYCDPAVVFGGNKVGGIRVSHLSDLDRPLDLQLTATRGKKAPYRVEPLPRTEPSRPTLAAVLSSAGLTLADLDAYVTAQGKPATSSLPPDKQHATADALAKAPDKLAAVRAHRDAQQQPAPFDRTAALAEIERLEPTVSGAEAIADAHGIGADMATESDETLTS